ncbi:MAG: 30S ribosome-binding factor RbfA [Deltaproteobacteria bacterium]|nr:30S ribosome-binding factor RbfA [Deltaproteobacteria bacterium]MBW2016798.1 30S ribosome-binding factor RbfA [Deltaproteobacteria bacterium]MBW2128450.1 30S ribosome-binding factor RbfA [Deltaproteobacteria bacterium]MBW2303496.1 30S ribosome-binding factor RbfA [Deltaproteobacteria bacterium]
MLAGKRAVRVGDQILREIADLLMRKVKDPRAQGATLTGIRLSNDLRHARVYFSVLGGRAEIMRVQAGLESAKGYIKREIGLRLDLKYLPEIVFMHDPSLEKGRYMEELLSRLKADAQAQGESKNSSS